jgi:tetratricopeptide (TPR) repeat protein
MAVEAFNANNLPLAKEYFNRALINARLGSMGPAAEADLLRKLGRTQGLLCEFDDAEKSFFDAIALEEQRSSQDSPATFLAKAEYAQFAYDTGRYEKAAALFPRAIAAGGKILEKRDPVSLALLLDDYADAMAKLGNTASSEELRANAARIRLANPDAKSGVVNARGNYVPYPKLCK